MKKLDAKLRLNLIEVSICALVKVRANSDLIRVTLFYQFWFVRLSNVSDWLLNGSVHFVYKSDDLEFSFILKIKKRDLKENKT